MKNVILCYTVLIIILFAEMELRRTMTKSMAIKQIMSFREYLSITGMCFRETQSTQVNSNL